MRRITTQLLLSNKQQLTRFYSTNTSPVVTIFGGDGNNPLAFQVLNQISNKCSKIKIQTNNAKATQTALTHHSIDQSKIEVIEASTTDDYSVASAIYGSDAVINVDRLLIEDARGYLDVYVNGVANIAYNAEKSGVSKFIQMSVMGAGIVFSTYNIRDY
jgi:nucleoside-diphosphate-sugar epimerase